MEISDGFGPQRDAVNGWRRRAPGVAVALLGLLAGTTACGPASDERERSTPDIEAVLALAEQAMGLGAAGEPLQVLADADVQGPSGAFRTEIRSSSDGRFRMEQSGGFVAGVGTGGGWLVDPESGEVGPLGATGLFVVGHELHMLAFRPMSRASTARYLGSDTLGSTVVTAGSFTLPSGDSLVIHYRESDSLPVGLRVTWTDPEVVVTWSDWQNSGDVRWFRTAEFRQGEEVFRYTYDRVIVGPLPDSVFEPPEGPGQDGTS